MLSRNMTLRVGKLTPAAYVFQKCQLINQVMERFIYTEK